MGLFFMECALDFRTNCGTCTACKHQAGPQQNNLASFKINLDAGQVKRHTHLGREFAIVPVIMVKSGVVMNESLVPTEELHPVTWNGVPVTVGHPMANGHSISANSPQVIEQWSVGTIYNSRLEGGDLKAEAWLDIERVNAVRPGLIEDLEAGTDMDVSTGYFSDDVEEVGTINGRDYKVISRNLNPDHLALLPDVSGACSWQDGCGVRANERSTATMSAPNKDEDEKVSVNAVTRILNAIGIGHTPKVNERGEDDDYRQMVADLISDDRSPFVPNDEESLRYMSYDTLKTIRDQYLGDGVAANKQKEPAKEEDLEEEDEAAKAKAKTNQEGTPSVSKDQNNNSQDGLPKTAAELQTLIANSVAEALKTNAAATSMSAADREALDRALQINTDHRAALITKITTNSDMAEDAIKEWPTAQLELIANSLRVNTVNYGGRGPVVNAAEDDPVVNAMQAPTLTFVRPDQKKAS